MRKAVMGAIIFVNFILESTLFSYLTIRQIKPNMAASFTVCYAILRGSAEGAIFGLCAGLLQDVVYGTSIGYYGLIYMTVGYLCGIPNDSFFKDNFYVPLIFTLVSMLVIGLYIYVTGFLIRGRLDFLFYLGNIILPETVYTTVFTFFTYRLMFGVNKKVEEYEYDDRKVF